MGDQTNAGGWQPDRLYYLDENLDIAGSEPISSLDEPIAFRSDRWLRLYPTPRTDENAASIDMYVNSEGLPTAVLEFCPEATPSELAALWQHVREQPAMNAMVTRWGTIRVSWGSPEERIQPLDNTLTIFFDDASGWAFLTLPRCYQKTYNDLLADYAYLRNLFEISQSMG